MEEKICPIRNEPCMEDKCAWFDTSMKRCWAVRDEVKRARDRELNDMLAKHLAEQDVIMSKLRPK